MVMEVTLIRDFDDVGFLGRYLLATVMFHQCANAPAILLAKTPGVSDIRLEVSKTLQPGGPTGVAS